jgi:hypothetical protein
MSDSEIPQTRPVGPDDVYLDPNMVEAVARAIYEAPAYSGHTRPWDTTTWGHQEFDRNQYRTMAKAAIRACAPEYINEIGKIINSEVRSTHLERKWLVDLTRERDEARAEVKRLKALATLNKEIIRELKEKIRNDHMPPSL